MSPMMGGVLADLDAPHFLAGGTPINRVSDTPKSPGFGCRETKTKLETVGEMLRGGRCSGSQLRNASWLRRRWYDALSRSASWYGRSNDVPTELSLPVL